MLKLYACITSSSDNRGLIGVAQKFAHAIEVLDDGVLFDVSGLERLVGNKEMIAQKIMCELEKQNLSAQVALAENAETAVLLARQKDGSKTTLLSTDKFADLPLENLAIEQDTLNVFNDLGINNVRDLLAVPPQDLVTRYGREFERVVRTIGQKNDRLIVPNVKETNVSWTYELDFAVEDFEQLIFVTGRGLDKLFLRVAREGLSTEQIDIELSLRGKRTKTYEIKASFPTLDKSFWLKLVNLRIALDPPESEIVSVRVMAHFTRPRSAQRGLYAVSRPEPESLLLTVNKLKKLAGEKEVGVPVLLDQRLVRPFKLDADKLPAGREQIEPKGEKAIIAFSYFRPAIRADVVAHNSKLESIRTRDFGGRVTKYSGVWRANSRWWDEAWNTQEWDVEIENNGVYRLAKIRNEWFLIGEYD